MRPAGNKAMGVLIGAIALAAAWRCARGGDLTYVKRDTRRATRDASLAASRPLPPNDKWWVIGPFDNKDNQGFKHPYPP